MCHLRNSAPDGVRLLCQSLFVPVVRLDSVPSNGREMCRLPSGISLGGGVRRGACCDSPRAASIWASPAVACTRLSCANSVGKTSLQDFHRAATQAMHDGHRPTLPHRRTGRARSCPRFCSKEDTGTDPWNMHLPVAAMTRSRCWIWSLERRYACGLGPGAIVLFATQTTSIRWAG